MILSERSDTVATVLGSYIPRNRDLVIQALLDWFGVSTLRVVIPNTSLEVTKKIKSVLQNLESGFFVALACSVDFLSVIFGFSMKFHVDVGGRKNVS